MSDSLGLADSLWLAGLVREEEVLAQESEDRRDQGQTCEHHEEHADNQPRCQGRQCLERRHKKGGEGGDYRGRGRHHDHANLRECFLKNLCMAFVCILDDVFSVTEQQEDDVVSSHTEHHHGEQGIKTCSNLEPKPFSEPCGHTSCHHVDNCDQDDGQDSDNDAPEDQCQEQHNGQNRKDFENRLCCGVGIRRVNTD